MDFGWFNIKFNHLLEHVNLLIFQSKIHTFTYLRLSTAHIIFLFNAAKIRISSDMEKINHSLYNPLVRRGAVEMTALRGRVLDALLLAGLLLTGVVVLADFFLAGLAALEGLVVLGVVLVGAVGLFSETTGSVTAGLSYSVGV